MRRYYSRLAQVEERNNIRSAAFYVFLTILMIVFLAIFGIPLVTKVTGFISDLRRGDEIVQTDTNPPPPPILISIPEFTNNQSFTVEGNTESGSNVQIIFNGETTEVVADNNGHFSVSLNLKSGDNTIIATSSDKQGNKSSDSKTYTVNFDNVAPKLTVTDPQDGANFYGSKKQLTIKGTAEMPSSLTINNRIVAISEDTTFKFSTNLTQGENNFNFKLTDKAGNQTEQDLKVNYTP